MQPRAGPHRFAAFPWKQWVQAMIPLRRVSSAAVFKAQGHTTGGQLGTAMQMEKAHDSTTIDRARRVGTWVTRMAVGLLLGCAIAVALVAAGLDLMLIRP